MKLCKNFVFHRPGDICGRKSTDRVHGKSYEPCANERDVPWPIHYLINACGMTGRFFKERKEQYAGTK